MFLLSLCREGLVLSQRHLQEAESALTPGITQHHPGPPIVSGSRRELKASCVEAGLTRALGSTLLHKKRAFAVYFIPNNHINSLLKGRVTDNCPEIKTPSS